MGKPDLIDRVKASWNFWTEVMDLYKHYTNDTKGKMSLFDNAVYYIGKGIVVPITLVPSMTILQYLDVAFDSMGLGSVSRTEGSSFYEEIINDKPSKKHPEYFNKGAE